MSFSESIRSEQGSSQTVVNLSESNESYKYQDSQSLCTVPAFSGAASFPMQEGSKRHNKHPYPCKSSEVILLG
jgi:hypothetical protein